MITAATAINILQALSASEMEKVRDYVLANCEAKKPKKRRRKEVVLRPEHSKENLKNWILEQNGTEIIYETKPAREN